MKNVLIILMLLFGLCSVSIAAYAQTVDAQINTTMLIIAPLVVLGFFTLMMGGIVFMFFFERKDRIKTRDDAIKEILAYTNMVDEVKTQASEYKMLGLKFNEVVGAYRGDHQEMMEAQNRLNDTMREMTKVLDEIRNAMSKEGIVLRNMVKEEVASQIEEKEK